MRASDRDRDVVHDLLGAAYADGRLTREELDERGAQTTVAKTLGDLPALVDDLVSAGDVPATAALSAPVQLRAQAEQRYRQQLNGALWSFLTPTLICWAVWLMTDPGGYPWPIWVMFSALPLLKLLGSKRSTIESIEQHLREKQERRTLPAPHDPTEA